MKFNNWRALGEILGFSVFLLDKWHELRYHGLMLINNTDVNQNKWFNEYGHFLGVLPNGCILDCSHAGPCDENVAFWCARLGFEVPREMAINWLAATGGWTRPRLSSWDDQELAERVLWLACCDLRESGKWFGMTN